MLPPIGSLDLAKLALTNLIRPLGGLSNQLLGFAWSNHAFSTPLEINPVDFGSDLTSVSRSLAQSAIFY